MQRIDYLCDSVVQNFKAIVNIFFLIKCNLLDKANLFEAVTNIN